MKRYQSASTSGYVGLRAQKNKLLYGMANNVRNIVNDLSYFYLPVLLTFDSYQTDNWGEGVRPTSTSSNIDKQNKNRSKPKT